MSEVLFESRIYLNGVGCRAIVKGNLVCVQQSFASIDEEVWVPAYEVKYEEWPAIEKELGLDDDNIRHETKVNRLLNDIAEREIRTHQC